jgi:hypothetical protein
MDNNMSDRMTPEEVEIQSLRKYIASTDVTFASQKAEIARLTQALSNSKLNNRYLLLALTAVTLALATFK